MTTTIRRATPNDLPVLDLFIRDLAGEEGLPTATATVEDLDAALFGADTIAQALIAEVDGEPAGFALYYPKYATVSGRRGFHLEDLFVHPRFRDHGLGRQIVEHLEQLAGPRGLVEWWVMHGNESAIRFYRRLGARHIDGIAVYRLDHRDLDEQARVTGLVSGEGSL